MEAMASAKFGPAALPAAAKAPPPGLFVCLALLLLVAHAAHAPHAAHPPTPADVPLGHGAHAASHATPPGGGAVERAALVACGAEANLAQRAALPFATAYGSAVLGDDRTAFDLPAVVRSPGCRSGPERLALLQVFRN
jgi:hypothetical protein